MQDDEMREQPRAAAFAGRHEPEPLPFDPGKLRGLSERLVRSHWENNYCGAVKALNAVERRLAAMLEDAELPPVLKALRGAGIDIVAIHQHMVGEQPRILFLHYRGVGPTQDLAHGLRAAIERTQTRVGAR